MRIVILGPPGAGKGSLAYLLKEELGISHISTGDILRDEIKNSTELGLQAQAYMKKGELVPDEIVLGIIETKFDSDIKVEQGYMLDGFPRTVNQAKGLDRILEKVKQPLDYVFYLESTEGVILSRLTGRRICRNCGALFHMTNKPPKQDGVCDHCGGETYQRTDDSVDTIKNRLNIYLESSLPVVEYYGEQGKIRKVDSDKEAEEVKEILLRTCNAHG